MGLRGGGRKDGARGLARGRGSKFRDWALRAAFIRAYVNGPAGVRGNVTRAMVHCGMASTDASARTTGARLMKDPVFLGQMERALHRADASADRVLEELARIAFADIREVVEWGPLDDRDGDEDPDVPESERRPRVYGIRPRPSNAIDDHTAAGIAEISQRTAKNGAKDWKVKMHGKVEALALLARIRGMIAAQRVEVTGAEGGPVKVQFYIPSNSREAPETVDAVPIETAALSPPGLDGDGLDALIQRDGEPERRGERQDAKQSPA